VDIDRDSDRSRPRGFPVNEFLDRSSPHFQGNRLKLLSDTTVELPELAVMRFPEACPSSIKLASLITRVEHHDMFDKCPPELEPPRTRPERTLIPIGLE